MVVDVGQRMVINCSIFGHPWDTVTWLHNGQVILPVSDAGRQIQSKGRQSVLVINEISPKDVGMYECLVENDHEDNAQDHIHVRLGGTT